MIDTGAEVNVVINEAMAEQLAERFQVKPRPNAQRQTVGGALGGKRVRMRQVLHLPLRVNDHYQPSNAFYVVPGLARQLIIGKHWLATHDFVTRPSINEIWRIDGDRYSNLS